MKHDGSKKAKKASIQQANITGYVLYVIARVVNTAIRSTKTGDLSQL